MINYFIQPVRLVSCVFVMGEGTYLFGRKPPPVVVAVNRPNAPVPAYEAGKPVVLFRFPVHFPFSVQ